MVPIGLCYNLCLTLAVYFYHLINVINWDVSQSDHIKWLLLYYHHCLLTTVLGPIVALCTHVTKILKIFFLTQLINQVNLSCRPHQPPQLVHSYVCSGEGMNPGWLHCPSSQLRHTRSWQGQSRRLSNIVQLWLQVGTQAVYTQHQPTRYKKT